MLDFVQNNYKWLFSGIGVSVIALIFYFFKPSSRSLPTQSSAKPRGELQLKEAVRVLFIDDDTRFKVAKILETSGWIHTTLIRDVNTLNEAALLEAHIVFVDVQGVGKKLDFQEEGLGLAVAIKKEHPKKKVIIYSAETKGDRFHAALREADYFLPKNADPYEFQQLVQDYAEQLDVSGSI